MQFFSFLEELSNHIELSCCFICCPSQVCQILSKHHEETCHSVNGVCVHTSNLHTQDMEAEGLGVQCLLWIHPDSVWAWSIWETDSQWWASISLKTEHLKQWTSIIPLINVWLLAKGPQCACCVTGTWIVLACVRGNGWQFSWNGLVYGCSLQRWRTFCQQQKSNFSTSRHHCLWSTWPTTDRQTFPVPLTQTSSLCNWASAALSLPCLWRALPVDKQTKPARDAGRLTAADPHPLSIPPSEIV